MSEGSRRVSDYLPGGRGAQGFRRKRWSRTVSNLQELAGIGDVDRSAVNVFGSLAGTIADFAGAAAGVVAIVQLMQSWTGTQTTLDSIKNAINAQYARLREDQKAQDITARLTNLDNETAVAKGVADGLAADVAANLSTGERNQRIETCLTALEALGGEAWNAPFDDQVYWNDWPDFANIFGAGDDFYREFGYGYSKFGTDDLAPAPDQNGRVLSYTYILAAYLRVLALVLAEIIALESPSVQQWKDALHNAAQKLQNVHDTILESIESLAPAPWSGPRTSPSDPLEGQFAWTGFDLFEAMQWFVFVGVPLPDLAAPLTGVTPLYRRFEPGQSRCHGRGCADRVRRRRSPQRIQLHSLLDRRQDEGRRLHPRSLPGAPPDPLPPSWYDPYRKFQVRLLKRRKDVYRGVGLPAVREAITKVSALIGEPPPAGPSPADWSLLQVSEIVGPDDAGQRSLRHVRRFLEQTPVYDLPDTYWSSPVKGFRALLEV